MALYYKQQQGTSMSGPLLNMPKEAFIKKIGIQLAPGKQVYFNGDNSKKFIIGKTGRLEFDNVKIKQVSLDSGEARKIPYIIDYIEER